METITMWLTGFCILLVIILVILLIRFLILEEEAEGLMKED